MILAEHTGHLTAILTPPVIADPTIGISGSGPIVRWTGDAQVHVAEITVDKVVAGQRVRITEAIVDIPANIPVVPNAEDELVWTDNHGGTETLIVREINRRFHQLGYFRMTCRLN